MLHSFAVRPCNRAVRNDSRTHDGAVILKSAHQKRYALNHSKNAKEKRGNQFTEIQIRFRASWIFHLNEKHQKATEKPKGTSNDGGCDIKKLLFRGAEDRKKQDIGRGNDKGNQDSQFGIGKHFIKKLSHKIILLTQSPYNTAFRSASECPRRCREAAMPWQ